jgi:hypothetical protein
MQNQNPEVDFDEIPSLSWKIQRIRADKEESLNDYVIIEEPLEVVVNGKSIAVLMRLPGQEKELAAGFCITEGYIRKAQDILLIHHCGLGLPAPGEDETEAESSSRNRIELQVADEGFMSDRRPDEVRLIRSGCGAADVSTITIRRGFPDENFGPLSFRIAPPKFSSSPDHINGWIYNEFKNGRGDDTSHHWSCNPFHHIRARSFAEHNGHQARKNHAHSHNLRPDPFDCTMHNAFAEVFDALEFSFLPPLLVGKFEVQEHNHPCLRIQSGQCDNPDPHSDAHVIIQNIEEPKRADK